MIKQLTLDHLNRIEEIFSGVIKDMNSNGYTNWSSKYPNKERFIKDIESNTAYGYFKDNKLVAYVALNREFDNEYHTVKWKYNHENSLNIHRLVVCLDYRKQGIATKLMEFAKKYAIDNEFNGIRFDALAKNKGLVKYYENLGYENTGFVQLGRGYNVMFELKIK